MSNQYYNPGPPTHGQGHPTVTIQHYDHPHPHSYPYSTQPQPIPQFTFGDIHDQIPLPPNNQMGFYPNPNMNPNIQFHESSVFPVPLPIQPPQTVVEPEPPTTQSKRHHYSKEQTEYLLLRFSENTHPSKERKLEISQAIGVTFQQVSTWFTNRNRIVKEEAAAAAGPSTSTSTSSTTPQKSGSNSRRSSIPRPRHSTSTSQDPPPMHLHRSSTSEDIHRLRSVAPINTNVNGNLLSTSFTPLVKTPNTFSSPASNLSSYTPNLTPFTPPFITPQESLLGIGQPFGFAPTGFNDQRRRSIANGEIAAVGNVARGVATGFPYVAMPPPTAMGGSYPMAMGASDPNPIQPGFNPRRRASAITTQGLYPRRLQTMAIPYARYTPISGSPSPNSPRQGRRTSSQYLPSPSGRMRAEIHQRQMSIGDSIKRPVQRLVSQHDLYTSYQEDNEHAPPQALDMPVYGLPPVSDYSFGGPTIPTQQDWASQQIQSTPTSVPSYQARVRNPSIISLNLNLDGNLNINEGQSRPTTPPDSGPTSAISFDLSGPNSTSAISYIDTPGPGPNSVSASGMSVSMSNSKSHSSSGSSGLEKPQEVEVERIDYYQGVDGDSSNDLFGGFMPDPPDPDQAYFEAYAALCLSTGGVEEVAT